MYGTPSDGMATCAAALRSQARKAACWFRSPSTSLPASIFFPLAEEGTASFAPTCAVRSRFVLHVLGLLLVSASTCLPLSLAQAVGVGLKTLRRRKAVSSGGVRSVYAWFCLSAATLLDSICFRHAAAWLLVQTAGWHSLDPVLVSSCRFFHFALLIKRGIPSTSPVAKRVRFSTNFRLFICSRTTAGCCLQHACASDFLHAEAAGRTRCLTACCMLACRRRLLRRGTCAFYALSYFSRRGRWAGRRTFFADG